MLHALGDENALGFSLHFDTNLLTYVSARRGADATAAPQFLVNTSELSQGLLGVGLLMPTDEAFPEGAQRIVEVTFRANANGGTTNAMISFGNLPVSFEASDPLANPLAISFQDGPVTLASDRDLVFEPAARQANGAVTLKGIGAAGRWVIQGSENLLDWAPLGSVTNTTGRVEFLDASSTNSQQRFYRAVKQ
jgi:hypothetical protein